jgi:tRNA1(Val) A37 N6-methylase TrmN6
MAKILVFPRLAQNFIKNGYYPTDDATIARTLSALEAADEGQMRILDPCAGEGVALAECKHHLGKERTVAFGVEYDAERAWHAKGLLDHCLHGDFNSCMTTYGSFGLLWLNPPYGDMVKDHEGNGANGLFKENRPRLEKQFYAKTHGLLQVGGVMVLILPTTSYDKQLSSWIASHFREVKVFRAATDQFKQTVLFGIKQKANGTIDTALRQYLMGIGVGDIVPDELPETWTDTPYCVPATQEGRRQFKFASASLDLGQLQQELVVQQNALHQQFTGLFRQSAAQTNRRPLRQMTEWHTALALAAGQVGGVVRSDDGRVYLIKGSTHKEKRTETRFHENIDGSRTEERIDTDVFVPVIRAIDFTNNSQTYGDVLMIR